MAFRMKKITVSSAVRFYQTSAKRLNVENLKKFEEIPVAPGMNFLMFFISYFQDFSILIVEPTRSRNQSLVKKMSKVYSRKMLYIFKMVCLRSKVV